MARFSDVVRSFQFPVLEEGNLSFPQGKYAPTIDHNGCTAHIDHSVEKASLIEYFVNNGKAACCCIVSIPKTAYRELCQCEGFKQKIEWDSDWAGEPPYLRPLIVCQETFTHDLKEEDGVHDLWIGKRIEFQKGAKIAIGPDLRPSAMRALLFIIAKDVSLNKGQIHIDPCVDNGFYFKVHVSENLYELLQSPNGSDHHKHRGSIMTHAVSSCFVILAKDYSEDGEGGWRDFSNLRALEGEMKSRGLPAWYEDDFKPEKVATAWHPHQPPDLEEDE